ncbi:hypothetical protein [Micromonospora sp. KLBMP9576]|uniref:hypothetical protein n=1 Tax=Micromonospora sp. KLBMP9576 TaxID=3424769 RepID=UPI003D948922
MSPDPTMPLPPSEPATPPPASASPYSAPPAAPYAVDPYYSAPPAAGHPAAPYSAPPGPHPPAMAHLALPPAGFGPAPQGGAGVQIGEIMVSPPVIHTPAGVLPLAGASWHVSDYWQREEKIAPWAVVCAIVGFFCLTFFSLLFLLIKETRHHGTVQVTVINGVQQYVARIPVSDQGQVQHINNQVNYARSLSAR